MKKLLLVGAVSAAIAACASAPQRSEQVEQARAEQENGLLWIYLPLKH